MQCALKLAVQDRSRFGNTVRANDLAVQVRKWLANDNSDDSDGNEHHSIHAGVNEVWKHVIKVEDVGNCTVENSNAGLGDCISIGINHESGQCLPH